MQLLIYFVSLGIILLGLIIGMVIAFFTKEELKEGKKYFKIVQILISASVIFLYLSEIANKEYYIISLMFLFGLPTGTLIMQNIIEKKKTKFVLKIAYAVVYTSFTILSLLLFL